MAKFLCHCGEILQTSGPIPNPIEWKVISDEKFDDFEGMTDAEDIYLAGRSMFRCPRCDRLWVFWDGFDQPPRSYAPE